MIFSDKYKHIKHIKAKKRSSSISRRSLSVYLHYTTKRSSRQARAPLSVSKELPQWEAGWKPYKTNKRIKVKG